MDALCVPVREGAVPIGAVHVYQQNRTFTQSKVHFCEAVAEYLGNRLSLLRLRRNLQRPRKLRRLRKLRRRRNLYRRRKLRPLRNLRRRRNLRLVTRTVG